MTAHDRNVSDAPVARTDTAPDIPVTHARRDTATVIVWRVSTDTVSDDDSAENPDVDVSPLTSRLARDAGDSPLTSRLARYLVAIYSDVHGTVIDFDADAQLRHAAETTGRHYRAVTDPHGLTTTPDQSQPATLITLRWPRPAPNAPGHDASSLLSACQQHLAHDGSIIVVVTATGAGGGSYSEHEQVLLPAARAAGLRHLYNIVALDADDGRDVFTYATARDTTPPSHDSDSDTLPQVTGTTLMIFGQPGRQP
jgi:hypothetical protein